MSRFRESTFRASHGLDQSGTDPSKAHNRMDLSFVYRPGSLGRVCFLVKYLNGKC